MPLAGRSKVLLWKHIPVVNRISARYTPSVSTRTPAITAQAAGLTVPSDAVVREVDQCYKKLDLSFRNAKEAFKVLSGF